MTGCSKMFRSILTVLYFSIAEFPMKINLIISQQRTGKIHR